VNREMIRQLLANVERTGDCPAYLELPDQSSM
jgi:hypothetical protein